MLTFDQQRVTMNSDIKVKYGHIPLTDIDDKLGGAGVEVLVPSGIRDLAMAARAYVANRRWVLVVDDDRVSRVAMGRALSDHHDVIEAEGFVAALLVLAVRRFDVVVTDYDLSSAGTGRDLLSEVRMRWPQMLRILCTGSVSQGKDAMSEGVAQHLFTKPIDRESLLAFLRRA